MRESKRSFYYDERHGLDDEWVRHILLDSRGVVLGTFLSGAYVRRNGRFERITPRVRGEATALVRDPRGALLVGTREGIWQVKDRSSWRIPLGEVVDPEVQALLATPRGLWIGLPCGSAFSNWRSLYQRS